MAITNNAIPEDKGMVSDWNNQLQKCFNEDEDYKNRIKNLSLLLNDILGKFEQSVNGNLFISNVGFRAYPDKYPQEKYLQIHDHFNPVE